MAFVFAASANFPPLILALFWRRFNTAGALTGIAFGIIASVIMIALSPPVWPGPDSQGSPSPLTFPGLVTIPIGFLGCWLGTMLSRRRRRRTPPTTSCSCARRPASAPREDRSRASPAGSSAPRPRWRSASHSPRARRDASKRPAVRAAEVAELGQHDRRRVVVDEQVRHHRLADALDPRLAEPDAEPAADHDRLGVEQVDRGGDAGAERLDGVLEQLERHLVVAGQRALPDAGGEPVAAALLHDLEQDGLLLLLDAPARAGLHRAAAGVGLHAAAAAAAALGAVDADDHVADLAGGLAADPRLAVEDQAAADAGAPEHAEQRVVLARGADLELGVGGEVDVVAERHRHAASSFSSALRRLNEPDHSDRFMAPETVPLASSTLPGEPTPTPARSDVLQPGLVERLLEHGGHPRRDRLRARP